MKYQKQKRIKVTNKNSKKHHNIARSHDVQHFNENNLLIKVPQHYAGSLYDTYCKFCFAFHWQLESMNSCCKRGKVKLPKFKIPPKTIVDLIEKNDKYLVNYNNSLAFTSMGFDEIKSGYSPIFKIQGKL